MAQLEARGETDRLATQLIRDHLPELQQHKLPHLSKQIGVDIETLAAELQFIRTLDPYPGRRYTSEEPILISPEIYIEKLEEEDSDRKGGHDRNANGRKRGRCCGRPKRLVHSLHGDAYHSGALTARNCL